ncbi:hydantoinase/oxoprolinase family protein [Methanolobus halotolerans]|uniref:H4MPT-linked C1 transfer pathway protein n=1 Tax=Methanolobus halotolerans TaxID=2052935 RepID=A0A4E0Q2L0_9EURY|nr:hydantoinase/oxoprolinase family protein [Methanolobus halotolerans]TGC07035.1 H4MPT-linked C1 transfer pathway protein [Methanolobus halotolerans]
MKIIGIDIGGANTKLASADGEIIELHYIPLWKDTRLPEALEEIAEKHHPDGVSVVMTGELADCFQDKEAGIKFIIESVDRAFDCDVRYIDSQGQFYDGSGDLRKLAAANWAASANLIGAETGDCIFVDMGSTTSDIIPIKDGKHVAGISDFSRLVRSELVYSGVLRTNLAYLLDSLDMVAGKCRVSSELFATTGDSYLVLDDIPEDIYTCETADGAGKSKTDAMRRLARVVCADLTEVSPDDIYRISEQVKEKQISVLGEAILQVAQRNELDRIVSAGLGEFLIREAAKRLGFECISVAQKWGYEISRVFPAYAAARMFEADILRDKQA